MNLKEAPSRAKQILKKNDILVSNVRPNLNAVAINKIHSKNIVVGSTGYCVLRCMDGISVNYIFNFCKSKNFVKELVKVAKGASYPAVSNSDVRNIKIPLPPIETQNQIAQTLDTVAELLALRKRQLAELDNLIKATFYEMFGDPVTNEKGWENCKLSDLVIIIMGQSPNGSSYNDTWEGIPLLNGPTEFGEKYPTEKQWTTEPTKMCKNGDILFCVRGATAGRMNFSDKEYCIGRGLAAIRPIQSNMQSFIYLYLKMMYSHFQSTSNGSTFINISKDQLENLPFLKIEPELQEQFFKVVTQIEEQKALVQKAIGEIQLLFDSLMSEYFE